MRSAEGKKNNVPIHNVDQNLQFQFSTGRKNPRSASKTSKRNPTHIPQYRNFFYEKWVN